MLEFKPKRFSDKMHDNEAKMPLKEKAISSGIVNMLQRTIGNAAVRRMLQHRSHNKEIQRIANENRSSRGFFCSNIR
ncbi:hypothetical protein BC351_03995 [Paenibacillus ferrarius]|uniref:Uncharacterized protein n=1 Tax=Paenibacillus ferrarius TaxID=1469647 RepID=A0A1V4HK70_9BACL|nr:hypothetical protein [Paenibacillus ferrarius]OPH57685.1 hypothetical protein BC351_03995 [Paenibacillus ferrarius]